VVIDRLDRAEILKGRELLRVRSVAVSREIVSGFYLFLALCQVERD
jgi:hypothetical protein